MVEIIRIARNDDAHDILDIYGPIVRETVISFELDVPTVEEIQARIENTINELPWLVIEVDNRILGYAYASRHRSRAAYQWSVDVSVYVDQSAHRKGYAGRLYARLIKILQAQNYYTAYAGIALPNEASEKFHSSMGFKMIGVYRNVGFKLGKWRDVSWWELGLRACDESPMPPRSLRELEKSGELAHILKDI